jgi:hypothetical protein
MSWFDNLWRRRDGRTTDDTLESSEPDERVADELEEAAHEARDEQAIEEPRPLAARPPARVARPAPPGLPLLGSGRR